MESVGVQIPAELFAALYNRYREDTGNTINRCLNELLDEDRAATPIRASTQHFMRPGRGTITGRVWEIADELYAKTGEMNREAVVTACMEEGIKMNTASTQYSHWKNAVTESGNAL